MKKQIVIDLDKVRDAQAFGRSDEIIQHEAMAAFFKHVKNSLDAAGTYEGFLKTPNAPERIRYHDTIALTGGRGSGKTTFILSMFSLIRRDRVKDVAGPEYGEIDGKNIEILEIFDPTLIEEKEHVFVNILSRIKRCVDSRFLGKYENFAPSGQAAEGSRGAYGQNAGGIEEGEYRDWQLSLKTLAAGLPAIGGIGGDSLGADSWHDPVYVMEQGLKSVEASNNLELNFHRFVSSSLKLIGKKAFILAFDDIDTQFDAGWPVLEIIRKYLTTPQLITIMSGDLSLYSKLIRARQWRNFGPELLNQEREFRQKYPRNDPDRNRSRERDLPADSYKGLVDRLEDQYLLKILKPERRIGLKPLYYYYDPATAKVAFGGKSKEIPMKRYIEELCRSALYIRDKDMDLNLSNLLQDSIRTIAQVLYGYYQHCHPLPGPPAERSSEHASAEAPRQPVETEAPSMESLRRFHEALVDTFLVSIHQSGFQTDFLKNPDPKIALGTLVVKLAEIDLLGKGYYLRAIFDTPDTNRLMLVLGGVFSRLIKQNRDLFFDFLVKVGLSGETTQLLPDEGKGSLFDYLQWTGLSRGMDAVTVARNHAGYIRALKGTLREACTLGTVAMMRPSGRRGKTLIDEDWRGPLRKIYGVQGENLPNLFGYDPAGSLKEEMAGSNLARDFLETVEPRLKEIKGKKKESTKYFYNYIEELGERITSWHGALLGLPAVRLINERNQSTTYWSIHCLLALLGKMIRSGKDRNGLKEFFRKYSQTRDYPLPEWAGKGESEISDAGEEESGEATEIDDNFIVALETWIAEFNETDLPPVHVVAGIFTRFHHALLRIDDTAGYGSRHLGSLFHRYIIVFLNSVLVEELTYRGEGGNISLDNPTGSDALFNSNLRASGVIRSGLKKTSSISEETGETVQEQEYIIVRRTDEAMHITPFFRVLMGCPLWPMFLNPDSFGFFLSSWLCNERTPGFHGLEKVTYCDNIVFPNLHPLLNSVYVHKMRSDAKPPKPKELPRWKISEFDTVVKGRESEVLDYLADEKDENRRVLRFIETYVEDYYMGYSKVPEGQPFQRVKSRIDDFMKNQGEGK